MKSSFYGFLLFNSVLTSPIDTSQTPANLQPRLFVPQNTCQDKMVGGTEKTLYLHKQVSELINCDSAKSCGNNHVESNTFTWEISAGVNSPFNSAGASVSSSVTEGNEYNCGGESLDTVCVWASITYKEYDVDHIGWCNDPERKNGRTTYRAPSTDTSLNHYYCRTGDQCKGEGEHYYGDQSKD